MKFRLRKPSPAPALAAVPAERVMEGFFVPRFGPDRKWARRLLLVGLGALMFVYAFFFTLLPRALLVPLLFPFLIFAGLIIWALPITDRAPGPAISRLFWGYAITLLLWPNYLALTLPGLPWITAARLLGGPMVLLMLVYASTSQPFRTYMSERLSAARPLWIFITIFAVLQVISIAMSSMPFMTVNRVFNQLVVWTGMFFGAVWVFSSPKRLERWVIAYVVMIAILGLIAIREAQVQQVLWANHIPSFLQVEDESVQRVLAGARRLTGEYRTVATSTTPLSFAELMALGVPFVLYIVHSYPRWWTILGVIVMDGLILNSLLLANSRLGFVGFIIGHFLYFLYYAQDRWRRDRQSLVGVSLIMMFPALVVLGTMVVLFVGRVRVLVLGGAQHQYSNDARTEQFNIAMQKIWASPVFGFGAGQGAERLGFANGEGTLTIDSYFVMVLMDYGFAGIIVFYGMLFYAIWQTIKLAVSASSSQVQRLGAVLGIVLAEFLVIKTVLSQEANHPLVFIIMGGIVGLMYLAKQDKPVTLR